MATKIVKKVVSKVYKTAKNTMATVMSKPMIAMNESKIRIKQLAQIMPKKYPNLLQATSAYQKAYNLEAKKIKDARNYKIKPKV